MDPWYSLGSGDMLEVAHMGLHVAQMTSQAAMHQCFDAVTVNPAKVMGLDDYGLHVGAAANLLVLDAPDWHQALQFQAEKCFVILRGRLVSEAQRLVRTNVFVG